MNEVTFTPKALRKWREGLGMTQEQLGEHLGVRQSTVGHWETGENDIRPQVVRSVLLLAQTLKVDGPRTRAAKGAA